MPPERLRPAPLLRRLNARARRVRLSSSTTMSLPHSSSVRMCASSSSARAVCSAGLWSLELAKTSAATVRRK